MKKTLCLALGAMLMLMLPGKSVKAQTIPVDLTVMTLDRATLTSACIYNGFPGVDYFIDSVNLDASYTGTAVRIDTVPHTNLTIVDGYNITGAVDTSNHAYTASFVVAKDANNRYYVLGAGNDYELGVFQATAQITNTTTTLNNFGYPITASHILLGNNAVVEDNVISQTSPIDSSGWLYTSLNGALMWASIADGITALKLIDDITLSGATGANIISSIIINQNGKTITNQLTVPAFNVNNSDLTWEGGIANINSANGSDCLFNLNNSSLIMRNVTATAGTSVAEIGNNSYFSSDVCSFSTLSDTAAIIVVKDASRAEVGTNLFSGPTGSKAALLAAGSTGTLDILASSVGSMPIYAYGRVQRANGHYMYSRDLNIAADSANGDTVYLNMNYTANAPQTVASPAVLQLGTYTLSNLYVGHTSDTATILGGKVSSITGISGNAQMVLDVDSLGVLYVANHPTTIIGGRYMDLTNTTGDPISIEGGKFTQRYDTYIVPRHFFIPNTDADASLFPWTIGTGYRVTWKNWDFFHDTTIVYNTPNNKIEPILSIPARFVGSDTSFIAWWSDSLYTTPWDFENNVLVNDDTLYAEWHIVDPLVETYYTVRHVRIGIDALDSIVDTLRRYATIGNNITVNPLNYPFYTAQESSVTFNMPSTDTVLTFHYVRDTFHLIWSLMGGHFTDNSSLNEYLAWGQPIDYSRVPIRRGYRFVRWQDSVDVMPQHDHAITALWERNTYAVVWNIPSASVTYNAQPVTSIYATYTHEEGTDTAILRFTVMATGFTTEQPVNAAEYKITALSQDADIFLDTATTTNYLTILPAGLTATGFEVENEKFYDGNDTAIVSTYATLNGVLANDEVILDNVHAHFSDATIGEGKSIIVYYGIAGAQAANYVLDTNAFLAATDGAILARYVYADTANDGIAVNAMGYCAGSDTIRYFLESGNPDKYNLIYSDEAVAQGFVNAGWTSLDASTPGVILIDVPADAISGIYSAKLVFCNSNHANMVSDTANIIFSVNLPKTYTAPLFDDVIALVDTCHCFTDIHWFHSTDGGATWDSVAYGVYYYQEVGGLTGQYRVVAKMNGIPMASCPQDDITTLLSDETAPAATVTIFPNPATERAGITVSNSRNDIHTLRVMNIMGVEMINTTFSGDNCQIDLRSFANGSYTVSVDGIVVRVIKK